MPVSTPVLNIPDIIFNTKKKQISPREQMVIDIFDFMCSIGAEEVRRSIAEVKIGNWQSVDQALHLIVENYVGQGASEQPDTSVPALEVVKFIKSFAKRGRMTLLNNEKNKMNIPGPESSMYQTFVETHNNARFGGADNTLREHIIAACDMVLPKSEVVEEKIQ